MAFHLDGSRLPGALWDDDLTTAFLGNERDEAVDGFLILGSRGVEFGTKLGDDELALMELRLLDAFFDLLILLFVPTRGKSQCREKQKRQQ